MIAAAATFALMLLLPPIFPYIPFGLLLFANGLAMGLFSAPNTAGIMDSVPAGERGVASGMRATFQNAGMNLSIGLFFSLMIAGLSSSLPDTLYRGLTGQGVPADEATRIAHLPPVGSLFAAFLGYNPIQSLLGAKLLGTLPAPQVPTLTGKTFFPNLISTPFMHGMHITFIFAFIMMIIAAVASWMRGKRYDHDDSKAIPVAVAGNVARPPMVTLGAAYGAGAGEIGRALARELGVPLIERAIPPSLADRISGPLQEAFEDEDRMSDVVSRLFDEVRISSQLFGIEGIAPAGGPPGPHDYRVMTERALMQLASTTGAIVVGHGASAALRSDPNVLRVAISAPIEDRIKRVMLIEGLDADRAKTKVEAADTARRAYMRRLYAVSPDDASLYQLMIDTSILRTEDAVKTVIAALESPRGM